MENRTKSYLGVFDFLLNLGDQSLQVRNFLFGFLAIDLLKVSDPGLDEVDSVLETLHGLLILSVEALSDTKLVVSLGSESEQERLQNYQLSIQSISHLTWHP